MLTTDSLWKRCLLLICYFSIQIKLHGTANNSVYSIYLQVQSRILADVISNEFRGVFDTEFIGLLQSFIFPQCMIQDPEIPPEMNENAQRFYITEDLDIVPLQREGNKKDPIFELFNPPTNSKPGKHRTLISYFLLLKRQVLGMYIIIIEYVSFTVLHTCIYFCGENM